MSTGGEEVQPLQKQAAERVYHAENEGLDGKFSVDQKKSKQAQGCIDENGKVTDLESQLILEHGADAVEARRCKVVFDDEQFVVERKQHGEKNHGQAVKVETLVF